MKKRSIRPHDFQKTLYYFTYYSEYHVISTRLGICHVVDFYFSVQKDSFLAGMGMTEKERQCLSI